MTEAGEQGVLLASLGTIAELSELLTGHQSACMQDACGLSAARVCQQPLQSECKHIICRGCDDVPSHVRIWHEVVPGRCVRH